MSSSAEDKMHDTRDSMRLETLTGPQVFGFADRVPRRR